MQIDDIKTTATDPEGSASADAEQEVPAQQSVLAGISMMSAEVEGLSAGEYMDAPFAYAMAGSETVILNSGALQYTATDFALPGRNGFDLVMTRRYDSGESNKTEMQPSATAQTSGRQNLHYLKSYGLGFGWSFVLPSIEIVPEAGRRSGGTYNPCLRLEDGRSFEVVGNKFKDYSLLDVTIEKKTGEITHPAREGKWAYHYVVSYKDGSKDYFKEIQDENKKLDSYRLTGRKDRFDNTIIYELKAYGGMRVIDSWGREIALKKHRNSLTWTLPDGGCIRYDILGNALLKVTDQESRATAYSYLSLPTESCIASAQQGGNTVSIEYQLLTGVIHPTGAVTNYTYGHGKPDTAMELQLNEYGGRRRSFPLLTRRDTFGGMDYNKAAYAFSLSENEQYIQTAEVENTHKVKEVHSFDDKHLRISFGVWHDGKKVTGSDYAYGTAEKDKKLLIREDARQYNQKAQSILVTTCFDYSEDKKGDVVRITRHCPVDAGNDQVTEMKYCDFSIMTEKSIQKDDKTTLVERHTLTAPGNKVVDTSLLLEKAGDTETLRRKTRFLYDDQFRVVSEQQYYGSGLADGGMFQATNYKYDDTAFTPQPVCREIPGLLDADGGYAATPSGDGTIRQRFGYDACGRLVSATGPNGNTSTTVYDKLGRPVRNIRPDGAESKTEYDDRHNRVILTDENGNKSRLDYTPLGQIHRVYLLEPRILTREFYYDELGRLVMEKTFGGDGKVRTVGTCTYDRHNRIVYKTVTGDGVDQKESHEYQEVWQGKYFRHEKRVEGDSYAPSTVSVTLTDSMGRVLESEAGDAVTRFFYDKLGNLLTQTDPCGNVSRCEYDWAGRAVKAVNALGQFTASTYDDLGNKIKSTDLAGRETRYEYDRLGRVIRQTAPFQDDTCSEAVFYYDAEGNLLRQKTLSNRPGDKKIWRESEFLYDNLGRQTDAILYTDQSRARWSRSHTVYDLMGNKLELHTGLTENASDEPAVCRWTYGRFGNVLTALDPRSCQLSADDPLYREDLYHYDRTGLLLSKTDRNGNCIRYEYDALNRIIRKSVTAENPSGTVTTIHETFYARNGAKYVEKSRMTAGGKTEELLIAYRYDTMGRLIRQEDPDGVVKTFSYDRNGNRVHFSLTRKGVEEISLAYRYDALNRIVAVKTVGQRGRDLVNYSYDLSGRRETKTYPKTGLSTHYAYNDAGLLTSLVNKRDDAVLSCWKYTYNLDGSKISETNRDGETTSYRYDLLGQLLEESDPDWNTIRYEYDRFGNRSRMTVTGADQYETRYEYHPNNWLLKEVKTEKGATETVVYQYDANGNQCYRKWERLEEKGSARKKAPQLSFSPHKDNTALDLREYDGFGSLILVFRDHIRTDYRYRPDGLRHSKVADDKGVATVTRHHWDGLGMVIETGENGNIKARYLRGGELLAQQIDGGTFHYLFDGHGNVTQRIGADGNAAPEYRYDAFGNQREPVATDPNPFRYCGEYFDAETGEVYLRNRSYSARSGRFTSEDPIRDGLNWYAYCGNNPVRFVDPLGLAYESEWSKSVSASDYKRPNTSSTSWLTGNTSDRGWSVGYINQRLYGDVKGPQDSKQGPNWSGLDWARSVSGSSSGDRLVMQSMQVAMSHRANDTALESIIGLGSSSKTSFQNITNATKYQVEWDRGILFSQSYGGYPTADIVAKAWARKYYYMTEWTQNEYASLVYMLTRDDGTTTYGFTHPRTSYHPNRVDPMLGKDFLPENATIVGPIHTHYDNLIFSKPDKKYANDHNWSVYLASKNPEGGVNVLDYYYDAQGTGSEREVARNLVYFTYNQQQKDAIYFMYSYKG